MKNDIFQTITDQIIEALEAGVKPWSCDIITMPEKKRFFETGDFYCTLLHELTHWTGHKKRLNREGINNQKDKKAYAFEELVAEIGSSFLCQTLGIKGDLQHENYIDYWLKDMKGDKRYIIKAASYASKAHAFLMPEYARKAKEEDFSYDIAA